MPAALRELGVRPSKRMGQNFLCDPRVARRVADLVGDPLEPVVEIGPGLGALSHDLASTGRPFVAVELDLRLAEHMEGELRPFPNARVVRGDILDCAVDALHPEAKRVTVIGNLPYSITTPALEWILGQGERVGRALLMVQREFAERLTAKPGSKEYGSISVFVGLNAHIKSCFRVSPGAFYPRPEVDSTVLEVTPRPYPGRSAQEREAAARVARASMGSRRKTLANALARGLSLGPGESRALIEGARLEPGRRGETLSIAGFLAVARAWLARAGAALAAGALLACSIATGTANAQGTEGAPQVAESPLVEPSPPQVAYDTSYNRDVSTGTWTQILSYALTRGRMSIAASGTTTSFDFPRSPGLGGQNGTIGGIVNLRALQGLLFTLNGTFNRVRSTDLVSETSQRQNRLKVSGQYNVSPLRTLSLQGVVSSELQRDHGLTIRPLGQERLRLIPVYNAAGDSVGVDSIFVHDQRDSTYMTGRQDGASAQLVWNPRTWLRVTSDAAGTQIRPATTSQLRDFARSLSGSPVEVVDRSRIESPNQSRTYQTKVSYSGIPRAVAWANVRGLHNTQQYFDKSLRGQEQLSLDQRGGVLHLDYAPVIGSQVSLEGALNRSLSGYTLRTGRSSLLTTRSLQASLGYAPSIRSRASAVFTLDRQENERQATGNGVTISRFMQANAAHRVSSRLGLDAAGTVSLLSFQYVDSILDQDNLRTYLNVGGSYAISVRCSTQVHFSTTQGHTVAIDASRSGSNNVQTTYQMDAALRLAATRTLSINQTYLLNAVYQIYDQSQAESRNVLSRIRRIDTTISDSIFTFATVRVTHNFLFRDSGSFTKPPGGSSREYNVGSETYQQTLGATLAITPTAGIQVSVTQSLANTRNYFPASKTQNVNNQWNLAVGATVERSLMGGATLRGSAQHIGAYTESSNPFAPLNEQDDWIAGVTFHKDF